MQGVFIVAALLGASYYLFAKRRFDISAVAYFSALAYFFPGFIGEVIYPLQGHQEVGYLVPIHEHTYAVMLVALASILMPTVFFDKYYGSKRPNFRLEASGSIANYAAGFCLVGLVLTWITMGGEVLTSADKNLILEESSRWSILWAMGSPLAFVLGYLERRFWIFAIGVLGLGIEMYIGFRGSTAIALIASICLGLHAAGPRRTGILNWRMATAAVMSIAILLIYKPLFALVKLAEWDLVLSLLADPMLYRNALFNSEPFLTQSILNEVIINDFQADPNHFLGLVYSLMLFSNHLGLEVTDFNQLFQPVLFPNITESGMAGNIWAEMYSSGGWPLLIIFALFFGWVACVGSYLLRVDNLRFKAAVAIFFCLFVFFFNRNDVLMQVTLQKRALLFFVLCWLCAKILPIRALLDYALNHRHGVR